MDESDRRIVILGKTGVGKSSVANTIFGEELFKAISSAKSGTSTCQAETRPVNGRSITLIDTPGFFNTDISEEELKTEILRCMIECAPGPHAFLIVFEVGLFAEHEQAVITKISKDFSEEVFKYATVLFTHGDQLDEGQTIEGFCNENKFASDLLKKCGGRCHVIDNKYWKKNQQDEYRNNQVQVKELLKTIDKMVKANKGSCYTNEMLQAVEEEIQKKEKLIRQSSGNMSQEEVRKQAKEGVFKRLKIKLAGIATGVLLGALFGGVTMVGEVLLVLKKRLSVEEAVGVTAAAAVAVAAGRVAAGRAAAAAGGVGAVYAVYVAAGAVKGGVAGYQEAEGADSPREAAQRAAKAVMDQALSPWEELLLNNENPHSKKGN
ncbi:GTPase IMAP family member 7-like isoform X2 [Trematomus bernacchii]|uniref:GTPase IMAP family member 7-like isoform X1 n=1 Tax=Trematomus bernacchii TaxID=40690 RepID=UPI00146B5F5B|nr:GTPase IMAP family member 7-like isoform X1 [Trematomus bernacchii]XP_034005994.1 GTPase IMAP family member 7-like isoform X1 [Trematomus bernacchii]XP_034005995.1 GTPase IMAP family member 7-like isoform X1 [Trematomus bernacchii]XP_034005996.1 GTPase IMAP family member 7-like isoform X1 [Trematomus bernacchii]XP_034005997.1 GTPase IMAP family member 7-like isoform X1 [Trematomus bernacchii]XP_034005998.1 GTPase IMAP family member 7-like isoform X2 [Trematomus bernacchii]